MPTLSNVGFGFLLPNGSNDLISNFFYWHYPKQSFSFCHSCINKTWTNICNNYMPSVFESLLTQGFHIVDLIGFSCTIGRCHRFTPQATCRSNGNKIAAALSFENVVEHINDKCPTYDISINSWTLYGIVKSGVNLTSTSTRDSKINVP